MNCVTHHYSCDCREAKIRTLVEAAKLARTYLEERGIRHKGITGRTKILPAIDEALKPFQENS